MAAVCSETEQPNDSFCFNTLPSIPPAFCSGNVGQTKKEIIALKNVLRGFRQAGSRCGRRQNQFRGTSPRTIIVFRIEYASMAKPLIQPSKCIIVRRDSAKFWRVCADM